MTDKHDEAEANLDKARAAEDEAQANVDKAHAAMLVSLDDAIGDILGELPPGPMGGRLATLIGAAMRASGLPAGECWTTIAALASDVHEGQPASVIVCVQHGGEGGEHELVAFQHNGNIQPLAGRTVGHAPPAGPLQ